MRVWKIEDAVYWLATYQITVGEPSTRSVAGSIVSVVDTRVCSIGDFEIPMSLNKRQQQWFDGGEGNVPNKSLPRCVK